MTLIPVSRADLRPDSAKTRGLPHRGTPLSQTRIVLSCLLSLYFFVTTATEGLARPRQVGGVGITVFTDTDFRGANATFREDVPDLRRYNLNDRIVSLRVGRGEVWEGCQDVNFRGRCQVFSGSESDLHRVSWNHSISSLRRVRGPGSGGGGGYPDFQPRIALFDRTGYRGRAEDLTSGASNLGSFGEAVESIRIISGTWELCEGPRWSGRCVTLRDSVSDLSRVGLPYGVGSARPVRR
jgi:Beta/Gamma crystallin